MGINKEIEKFKKTKNIVLLDVRTKGEYSEGHIPGSQNIPLDVLKEEAKSLNKDFSIFVYCHSGARSQKGVEILKSLGFKNVKNIGGIVDYSGLIEK